MVNISLCMIVKNEEKNIENCLKSIEKIIDEIIIIDTGSTDSTKKIAAEYTNLIYDFKWSDDFSMARNYSFSKATKDYIMWLDADDIITNENQKLFKELKENLDNETDIVMCKYNTAFDEEGHPTFFYYRERIIRRSLNLKWKGAIHEAITPTGKIIYSDFAVNHNKTQTQYSKRNLKIFEKLILSGKILEPREQFYYARELYYHEEYKKSIDILSRFLDSNKGWIENNLEACKILSYCFYKINDENSALRALIRSFEYDEPRAETCCDIAKHFLDRDLINQSIFWYKTALSCSKKEKTGAFTRQDCYNFLPFIQLSVCYDKLKDMSAANYYNEMAGKYRPKNQAYLRNKEYFRKFIHNSGL
ncbi:MAG: glycosyltransferase [Oscillospiraceae bacterium]|nr:glycosyltransferase [Oscillospiraceae bacterium]